MREGWIIWGGTGAPSPQGEGGYLAAELVAVLLPAVPCVAVTYLPVHEEPVVLFRFGLCVALHFTPEPNFPELLIQMMIVGSHYLVRLQTSQ